MNTPLTRSPMLAHPTRTLLAFLAPVIIALTGCASDGDGKPGATDTPPEYVTVVGHLSDHEHNQDASDDPAASSQTKASAKVEAKSVTVGHVGDDGTTKVIATALISADGSFEVPDVTLDEDTLVVQAWSQADGKGELAAEALVAARGATEGSTVHCPPMNSETSHEARSYMALRASGHVSADIDVVALMRHIDGRMSATADASASAEAAWQAQLAERASLSTLRGKAVTAAETESVCFDAWKELTASLHADDGAKARGDAWVKAMQKMDVATRDSFGLDADELVVCRKAASDAQKASASSQGEAFLAASARHASWIDARSSWHAEKEAMTKAGGSATLLGKLDTTYKAYLKAVASASSSSDIDTARSDFAEQHAGIDSETAATSTLEAAIDGSLVTDTSLAKEVWVALDACANAAATLDTALEAAASAKGAARAEAIAKAWTAYHGEIDAALDAAVKAGLGVNIATLIKSGCVAADTELSEKVDISEVVDSLALRLDKTLDFVQQGAVGITGTPAKLDLAGKAKAVQLLSIRSDGSSELVGETQLDDASSPATLPCTERPKLGVVQVSDAKGTVLAATLIHMSAHTPKQVSVPPMSAESTLEALVVKEACARQGSDHVDTTLARLMIDGATAAAAKTKADRQALAAALINAQAAEAKALDTNAKTLSDVAAQSCATYEADSTVKGGADAELMAQLESGMDSAVASATNADVAKRAEARSVATASWAATVETLTGKGSELAAAALGRARLCHAPRVHALVKSFLDARSVTSAAAELDGSLSAYSQAIAEASSRSAIDSASAEFAGKLWGSAGLSATGAMASWLSGTHGTNPGAITAFEGMQTKAASAGSVFHGEVLAAAESHVASATQLNAAAMATACLSAHGSLTGSVQGTVSGLTGAGISQVDASAMANVAAQLSAGGHLMGAAGG